MQQILQNAGPSLKTTWRHLWRHSILDSLNINISVFTQEARSVGYRLRQEANCIRSTLCVGR